MIEDLQKQITFAKSHSTIRNAQGVCVYKGKKLLVSGFSRLPLNYKYSSENSPQHTELHISAIQDIIMKLGSYRRVSYNDLDIVMDDHPSMQDMALIADMGFRKLIILSDNSKGCDPIEYFHNRLREQGVKF